MLYTVSHCINRPVISIKSDTRLCFVNFTVGTTVSTFDYRFAFVVTATEKDHTGTFNIMKENHLTVMYYIVLLSACSFSVVAIVSLPLCETKILLIQILSHIFL